MAINLKGNFLVYLASNSNVATVCTIGVTKDGITLGPIESTIATKTPITDLRFTDDHNILVTREDPDYEETSDDYS